MTDEDIEGMEEEMVSAVFSKLSMTEWNVLMFYCSHRMDSKLLSRLIFERAGDDIEMLKSIMASLCLRFSVDV